MTSLTPITDDEIEALARTDTARTDAEYLRERIWRALPIARPQRPRLRPLALGGLILGIATVSIVALVPGGPVRPTPSFAQVEQAMGAVKTVTWNIESRVRRLKRTGGIDTEETITRSTAWVDLKYPRMSVIEGSNSDGHSVFDGVATFRRFGKRGNIYYRDEFQRQFDSSGKPLSPLENVRRAILFSPDRLGPEETQQNLGNSTMQHAYSPWKSEERPLDGKTLLCFTRTDTVTITETKSRKLYSRSGGTERVWVEPISYHIVRRETLFGDKYGTYTEIIERDFRYDLQPPTGIFDITPPAIGVPYYFSDMSLSRIEAMHTPVSKADSDAIRGVIERLVSAWNRNDKEGVMREFEPTPAANFAPFLSSPSKPLTEEAASNRRMWKFKLVNRVPYQNWRNPVVTKQSYGMPSLSYVRRSESDPFPPKQDPYRETNVRIKAWVRLKNNPKRERLLPTTVLLTKQSGVWKWWHLEMFTSADYGKSPK